MPTRAENIIISIPSVDSGSKNVEFEPSLRKSFEGRYLNKKQALAVDILDRIGNFSPSDRNTLFYYFLWHETGLFAPIKQFGEIKTDAQIDSIINKVSDDDRLAKSYDVFYCQYKASWPQNKKKLADLLKRGQSLTEAAIETELSIDDAKVLDREIKVRELLEKPYVSDVLTLKKQGLSYVSIMNALGISESKVSFISGMLIAAGLIEPNPKGRAESKEYVKILSKILPLREKLNIPEIADKTGYSQEYVKSIFGRMRSAGQVRKLDKRMVMERTPVYKNKGYLEIRDGVKKLRNSQDHKYTEQEIAGFLSKELVQDVTIQQVKRQIRTLLADGEIKRRVS